MTTIQAFMLAGGDNGVAAVSALQTSSERSAQPAASSASQTDARPESRNSEPAKRHPGLIFIV